MKFHFFTFGLNLLFSGLSMAQSQLPTAAQLKSDDINVYDFWAGEYPRPVIQVNKAFSINVLLAKNNDLKKDLLDGAMLACTINENLYHPWAEKTKAKYATLVSSDKFRLKKPMQVLIPDANTTNLPIGHEIEIQTYLSEGLCRLATVINSKKYIFDDYCPDDANMEKLSPTWPNFDIQFMQVPCDKKYKAWILVDDKFMSHAAVSEGQIVEYGKIKKILPPQKNPVQNEY